MMAVMAPVRRLAGLALAVVVFGACGGDDGTDVDTGGTGATTTSTAATTTTTGPDSVVSSPPVSSGPTVPTEPGRPERVEPRPGMADVTPVAFDPSEAEATDGGVLVRFWGGVAPCFVLDSYEVVATPDTVTVTLHAGRDATAGDVACIEIAMLYETLVPLDARLGERTLVDGSAA